MKRTFIILIYIYICLTGLSGQEVKVSAAFDSARIYIGDQIKFTVTVDKPVSYLLSIPVYKDTLQKNIEILNGPSVDTSILKDGRIRIREKYLITSFDSGFYQIAPVYAEMRSETGIKRFYSDYSKLEVMRVKIPPPDAASKIFDIVKPYNAPLTIGEILPWVLLFLLVSASLWFLIRYIRNLRMKKAGAEPVINPDPAHLIAFRQLEKLKEEKLWQKGEIKKYYTRLTEILRQYLENRYRIFSMEMTTVETLAELTKSGFRDDENYRKLRNILTGADLVKFAKYNPEPSENELHFDYAWQFVKFTTIEDQPSVETTVTESGNEEGS
jgi:hypothetical protein